jgi:hypothetical protein
VGEKTSKIEALEQQIADLEARLPKHSVPASMLIELEDLEEALKRARAEASEEGPPEQTP